MKKAVSTFLFLTLIIVFTGCSESTTTKLNDDQQALADVFFANKDKWETYEDLYCTDFQMFSKSKDGVTIHCGYSNNSIARSNEAVSSHTVIKAFSYTITKDEFTIGQETSLLYSGELLQKDEWGNNKYGFIGQGVYYFGDDEQTKKKEIEKLFSKFE